jgi:hypothetical protein
VKEILEMKSGEWVLIQDLSIQLIRDSVHVIIVLTKFDVVVSRMLAGPEGRNSQHDERARTRAYTQCEESCRSLFCTEPKDVPAEIVSGSISLFYKIYLDVLICLVKVQFGDLIGKLVTTTDRFIMGSRTTPTSPTRSNVQEAKPRVAPVPLVWSVASRASQNIIILACIEYVHYL